MPIKDLFARLWCAAAVNLFSSTGSGHYSPVAGYHPGRDLVLILDTARFKYPPYWVSVTTLWNSMQEIDIDTGKCFTDIFIANTFVFTCDVDLEPSFSKVMYRIDFCFFTAAGLPRGYVILRRSGTDQLVLFGVSKYLMAAVDREEDMTPGIRSFIKSWNGWICDKASRDLNKNTAFRVIILSGYPTRRLLRPA